MTEINGDPSVQPPEGRTVELKVKNLANALELIRRAAWMHWMGQAFDPEHMWSIAALAAQALCGEPIETPTSIEEIEDHAKELSERINDLVD